jgi:hypothetical protein
LLLKAGSAGCPVARQNLGDCGRDSQSEGERETREQGRGVNFQAKEKEEGGGKEISQGFKQPTGLFCRRT